MSPSSHTIEVRNISRGFGLKKLKGIWMNRRTSVNVFFITCLAWIGVANAGSAEDAWKSLVSPKHARQAAFSFVKNDPDLPNVLIYGDSISIHYTQVVRDRLAGQVNVYRIYENGGDSGTVIRKINRMQDVMRDPELVGHWSFKWDVIQFNVGLHDLKYVVESDKRTKLDKINGKQVHSLEEYRVNLSRTLSYLESTFPGAKLVFATTTPVPAGEPGRVAGDAQRYNAVALEVIKNHPAVIVNDLYAFTKDCPSSWWLRPGNVHFGPEGRNAQGVEVARVILSVLE
jgi:hypothetical protein